MAAYLSDPASYRALKRALDADAAEVLMELTGAETEHDAREQARTTRGQTRQARATSTRAPARQPCRRSCPGSPR